MDPNDTLSNLSIVLQGHWAGDPQQGINSDDYRAEYDEFMAGCVRDLKEWIDLGGDEPEWENHPWHTDGIWQKSTRTKGNGFSPPPYEIRPPTARKAP